MTLRQVIKNQIIDYLHENDIDITQEELRIATNGVEYYISEVMADSVKDSVNDILYSRKSDSNFPKGMPDSFKNFIAERKQNN